MTSPVDLVNQALAEIDYSPLVGDLYEGSPASIVALQVYGQTRDDLLRAHNWPFSRRTKLLTLLKSALVPPADTWTEDMPVPPWRFEYEYPEDCLEIRCLRPDPVQFEGGDSYEPGPILFQVASDFASAAAMTAQKVVLSDLEFALAIYTARITDLDQWEPLATSAFVDELARVFAAKKPDLLRAKAADAEASAAQSDRNRG